LIGISLTGKKTRAPQVMEDSLDSLFGKNYIKAHEQGMDMDENTRLSAKKLSSFQDTFFNVSQDG